jgi:hypothetical protein
LATHPSRTTFSITKGKSDEAVASSGIDTDQGLRVVTIQLPNFFVLGAGRCGTTTLAEILSMHPQIFMSTPKEPTFFSEPFQQVKNPVDYAALFEGAAPAVAIGEASHAYFSHPRGAATLRAFFPEARFVLIVRHPADRARALYLWMRQTGYEPLSTFERALAAEERRYRSARFAKRCALGSSLLTANPEYFWNFMYFRSGLFGEQFRRYLDLYSRDRFYITTLSDLTRQTDRVLAEICDFLGVSRLEILKIPRRNQSVGIRSYAIKLVEIRFETLAAMGLPKMKGVAARIRARNRCQLQPFDPHTRSELAERFRDDLDLFRTLTGVDLMEE